MKRDRLPFLRRLFNGKYKIFPNDGDVAFIDGVNFSQAIPHTDLFEVDPSVSVLIFRNCNLINVTVPDGAIIDGGNPAQMIPTATGNRNRPYANLLCEDVTCAAVHPILRPICAAQDRRYWANGRLQHHLLKPLYRARRTDPVRATEDLTAIRAENAARLAELAVP